MSLHFMKKNVNNNKYDSVINFLFSPNAYRSKIPINDILMIIQDASRLFLNEPTLLQLHPPLNIVGDIHGQFPDLLRIFEMDDKPPNARYLFLGDYVDRGPMGLEVICLLLALKLKYPNHIYMLRGNHETRETTELYGFCDECTHKTNKNVYTEFCTMFDNIPIAALISNKILCVHGGISPTLKTVDQIAEIARPADASYKGFLADLLWSDPNPELEEYGPNSRGDTIAWGLAPVKSFLQANNLSTLVRAHQLAQEGYEYPFNPDKCVITIFSAPCYAGEYKNRGAYIRVDKSMAITPVVLPHEPESMAITNHMITPRPVTTPPGAGGKGKNKGGKQGKNGGKGKNKGRK